MLTNSIVVFWHGRKGKIVESKRLHCSPVSHIVWWMVITLGVIMSRFTRGLQAIISMVQLSDCGIVTFFVEVIPIPGLFVFYP